MKRLWLVLFAAAAWPQEQKPGAPLAPEVIPLDDALVGVVQFQHRLHEQRAEGKCETCHHGAKPEKPESRLYQACRDCHTKPPQAGMKTSRQAAFHNPPAQSGTCVDCHKRQLAAGRKTPQKCFDCHKRQTRGAAERMSGPPGAPGA